MLQEYDLEFKLATIIKGKGLCKLIAKGHTDDGGDWENKVELNMIDIFPISIAHESWYRDLVHYLQQGYLLEHWKSKK